MTKIKKGKKSKGKYFVLEKSASFNVLCEIKTSKKNKMEEELKKELQNYLENREFNKIRKNLFDIAIVIYVTKNRMKRQDVDNIAKIILDVLKKSRNKEEKQYLFEDDSQVIRLLVYKIEQDKDIEGDKTDEIIISFREHDQKKQMILVNKRIF